MNRLILFGITLLMSASLFSYTGRVTKTLLQKEGFPEKQSQSVNENEENSVIYKNTQYGFAFSLPDSWKGYTIVTEKWEGLAVGDAQTVETGPIISIRHPEWTRQNQRQDIPVMIFTLNQWNALQQEKFHIGAAPIGPSALGRNGGYVFALPARYNYAFPTGYEEVEEILKNKPLQSLITN